MGCENHVTFCTGSKREESGPAASGTGAATSSSQGLFASPGACSVTLEWWSLYALCDRTLPPQVCGWPGRSRSFATLRMTGRPRDDRVGAEEGRKLKRERRPEGKSMGGRFG